MKKKKKPLDLRLWKIEELGSQVEAIGFLLRFHNSDIPLSSENYEGLGGLLESLGTRIQNLKHSIFSDLFNPKGEIRNAILEEEKKWK